MKEKEKEKEEFPERPGQTECKVITLFCHLFFLICLMFYDIF